MLLKLKNVKKNYKINKNEVQEVLKDINLTLKSGEFVCIYGESGSGKSTLMNIIGGLDDDYIGTVTINKKDIKKIDKDNYRKDKIGFVFQNFNLIPEMNVFENIVLPAKLMERNISKKEVMRIVEELEIEEKLLQNPMTLSGGQQQRVAIARAIYTHPTILLGDELTGNLDSTTSISVMKFLKKMCKKYSQTMIIVTHDERIAAMADRIIQMKDGRVV